MLLLFLIKGLFSIGIAALLLSSVMLLAFPYLSGQLLDVAAGNESVSVGQYSR